MVDHGKSTKRKKHHDKDKYYRRKFLVLVEVEEKAIGVGIAVSLTPVRLLC